MAFSLEQTRSGQQPLKETWRFARISAKLEKVHGKIINGHEFYLGVRERDWVLLETRHQLSQFYGCKGIDF